MLPSSSAMAWWVLVDVVVGSGQRRHQPAGAARSSAEAGEELAQVGGEQVGGVVGGPVAAAVELAPGDDVGVVALGELADRSEVEGEVGQALVDGGRLGRLGGVLVLVVAAGRRRGGVG